MFETIVHKWLRIPHVLHVGDDTHVQNPTVTIVFVHGLANSHAMWKPVIDLMRGTDARIMSVDLLGFGKSPKPEWQTYSALVHAKSLRRTLRAHSVSGPVIIVGHSLGSLVAVKYAQLYPSHIQSLLLCSPPFYKETVTTERRIVVPTADDVYRQVYSYGRNRVDVARKIAAIVKRAKLVDPGFTVDDETLPAIIGSLEMSIENQTSLQDAETITIPMHIIYGRFDVFVIRRNLRSLEKNHDTVSVETIMAGHELTSSKVYVKRIAEVLATMMATLR